MDSVLNTLSDNSIDVAGICETWLPSLTCPTTAMIKSYGYSLLHSFRDNRRGGGTALVYKSCYSFCPHQISRQFYSFEYTASSIKTATGTRMMFVIVYRTGQLTSLFAQELDYLLSIVQPKCDCLILAGDFNIHFDQLENYLNKQVLDLFLSYGLERYVFEPTHIAGGSLDQIFVFSLHHQLQCSVTVDSSRSLTSDHFPVYCDLSMIFEKKYFKKITYRKVSNIDQSVFKQELSNIVQSTCDSNECFQQNIAQVKTKCNHMLDKHCPFQTKTVSTIDTAPWFDKEYRELRKARRRAEYRMKKPSSTLDDKIAFKEACQECTMMAKSKKMEYFKQTIIKANGNPRTLYQFINKSLDRKQVKPLPDYTNDLCKLAEDFNSYFTDKIDKIRSELDQSYLPSCHGLKPMIEKIPQMGLMFDFTPTDIDEIREIIKDVGIKCSPADLLPQKLFKENIDLLLPLIVKLVNMSLLSGNVDGAKLADIIPLLKNEALDPNLLKNFRPVSNLTFIGKIIERVVLKQLNEHLSRHNLNCSEQSAYKKNNSTETLLIRIWNDLLVASDKKSATVLIMLDLSAAFDTVDHDLLLRILKHEIGLRGKVLQWFTSFLKGRTQRIRIDGTTSDECLIKFGVPQGSVLGPVLFNIYIRSIYKYVHNIGFDILGYADDHQVKKAFNPSLQGFVLTYDVENCFLLIKSWMKKYYLQMNNSKTEIIIFGAPRVLKNISIHGVNIANETTIRFVSSVKNLGMYFDSGLTLGKQIIELKKKCFYTLRNINKIRFLLSYEQRKVIVNSLVVSCLDYCNGLYFGISQKLMNQLQILQNACAKAVMGKYKYDHLGDDLKTLHWLNIKKRILFKIGLLAYKAVNGLAPQYLQDLFQYSHHGHTLKLIVPANNCTKSYGQRSFSVVGPTLLNNLPSSITQCDSVKCFKSALKTLLFDLNDYELNKLTS